MKTVTRPAPISLKAMTSLRFQRSTNTPAIGEKTISGANEKKPTSAKGVAWPVCSQAQMPIANCVICEPIMEKTWPIHTMIKPRIPLGLGAMLKFPWCKSQFREPKRATQWSNRKVSRPHTDGGI